MTRETIFWILMLLWLVLGIWSSLPSIRTDWRPAGGSLLLFLLLLLLGWQAFGAPIHG